MRTAGGAAPGEESAAALQQVESISLPYLVCILATVSSIIWSGHAANEDDELAYSRQRTKLAFHHMHRRRSACCCELHTHMAEWRRSAIRGGRLRGCVTSWRRCEPQKILQRTACERQGRSKQHVFDQRTAALSNVGFVRSHLRHLLAKRLQPQLHRRKPQSLVAIAF